MARRKTKRKENRDWLRPMHVFWFLVLMVVMGFSKRVLDTLSPEAITVIAGTILVLFAAVIIAAITVVPFLIMQNSNRQPRRRRLADKQQDNKPTIIVMGAPQPQNHTLAPEQPQKLLPDPDYTEGSFRVIQDAQMNVEVIGSEDEAW